jgi:hypothetical protein
MSHMASRSVATWVPNQHGAWAMLIAPALVGAVVGGVTWWHALLLVAWLTGYCCYFTWGQWLRTPPARRARWHAPMLVYGAISLVSGLFLLVPHCGLLAWAPAYIVLMSISLACTAKGATRGWLNDVDTLAAACLLTVVAAGVRTAVRGPVSFWWPPPGATDIHAWIAAAALAAYFLGTVFYVKTMIRDKGSRPMYAASVAYHACVAVAAWLLGWPAGLLGLLLLARAAGVPKLPGPVTPKQIGFGEVAATVLVIAVVLLR